MKFEETSLTFDLKLSETTPIDAEFDALQTIHGRDGITPHIGENGNWYIGDEDTGVKAQGADGKDGIPGKDGYTPQKGVDYFTEADKAEIVDAVIAKLPIYNGEVAEV